MSLNYEDEHVKREADREAIAYALFRCADSSRDWANYGEHVRDHWLVYADAVLALGFRRTYACIEDLPGVPDRPERVKCRGCRVLIRLGEA